MAQTNTFDESVFYRTVRQAENAITEAGFRRDDTRGVWTCPGYTPVKVKRDSEQPVNKFYITTKP